MKYKDTVLKVITECCRILIGSVFVFSGVTKAIDPVGFAIKISEYLAAFGLDALQSLSTLAVFNIVAIEFMLGVCMLLGVYRKYTSLLTLVVMSFMTPLTLYLALFDPVSDCGCFGDAFVISNWETFFKNVALLVAAIFTFINNQRMFQLYTFKVYWFVALFSYFFCIGFAYRNYIHLPIIDFRPYKTGANIPELMAIPEDAEEDEYKYSFIYEKDGKQKEFSLEELPEDSTWIFVESTTQLIKKGYEPPVAAFNLYNLFGADVTDEVLGNDKGVFLLISDKLEKANDTRIDEINGVYDYAQEHNLEFYGVTGSSLDDINKWCDFTGAEYPFLMADDVLLKTIIRSNPGLVLLKGGTVLRKWNYRDIPREEFLETKMEATLQGNYVNKKEDGRWNTILLSFTVPLLLVWLYDFFRNRRKSRKRPVEKPEEENGTTTEKG